MILVNDKQVEFTKFPDGTTSFRYNPFGSMTRIKHTQNLHKLNPMPAYGSQP